MSTRTQRLSRLASALRRGRSGAGAGGLALRGQASSSRSARRWMWVGIVAGAVLALGVYAPARWLASALASASQGRVLLADASGSLWNGSAVLVLAGGEGAIESRMLPGRLSWTLQPRLTGLDLHLQHDCCINGRPLIRLLPGAGTLRVEVRQQGDWLGSWPAALLVGLGTPWNTLQPGGDLRMSTPGFALVWAAGRFAFEGRADIDWRDVSSRVATLPRLGSYRLALASTPNQAGTASLLLSTVEGPLLLSGTGSWSASGLRLRGEANAAEADQPALANLLNIIGRRDGARSLISIG